MKDENNTKLNEKEVNGPLVEEDPVTFDALYSLVEQSERIIQQAQNSHKEVLLVDFLYILQSFTQKIRVFLLF